MTTLRSFPISRLSLRPRRCTCEDTRETTAKDEPRESTTGVPHPIKRLYDLSWRLLSESREDEGQEEWKKRTEKVFLVLFFLSYWASLFFRRARSNSTWLWQSSFTLSPFSTFISSPRFSLSLSMSFFVLACGQEFIGPSFINPCYATRYIREWNWPDLSNEVKSVRDLCNTLSNNFLWTKFPEKFLTISAL